MEDNTLVGPLHSEISLQKYKDTIEEIKKQGGTIEYGGKVRETKNNYKCIMSVVSSGFKSSWILRRTNHSVWLEARQLSRPQRMFRSYCLRLKSKQPKRSH